MFYDRKIKYFDYVEHGERLRNSGFVKLEARDDICNLTIHISSLHNMSINSGMVYVVSGDRREKLCEANQISISVLRAGSTYIFSLGKSGVLWSH